MPINLHNPFKGRQHPGEVIVLCVRWPNWWPERGVEVDASLHLALSAGICT